MSLPIGASFLTGEYRRIEDALKELAKDPHAARQLTVTIVLNPHVEYPKHLTFGKKTVVVNSADEEAAIKANLPQPDPEPEPADAGTAPEASPDSTGGNDAAGN